jgi:hypothetical protein
MRAGKHPPASTTQLKLVTEESLGDWAATAPVAKKRPARMKTIPQLIPEVERMLGDGEWSKAHPRHFVALYAELHKRVYGFLPSDMLDSPKARLGACGMAKRMLEKHFGSDPNAMATFFKWFWEREHVREMRRRNKGQAEGWRVGWRWMFNSALVDDYRVEAHRLRAQQ